MYSRIYQISGFPGVPESSSREERTDGTGSIFLGEDDQPGKKSLSSDFHRKITVYFYPGRYAKDVSILSKISIFPNLNDEPIAKNILKTF
jgi:hypothetical protein